jgi:hypothetical protein
MSHASLASLADVFASVLDSRDPRGVRHSIQVLVSLVFLGMLARIREMVVLQRWAELHWSELRSALGSDCDAPPNATTISHALAGGRSLAEVRVAAGHTNLITTSAYLHIAVDTTPCRAICSALSVDCAAVDVTDARSSQGAIPVVTPECRARPAPRHRSGDSHARRNGR